MKAVLLSFCLISFMAVATRGRRCIIRDRGLPRKYFKLTDGKRSYPVPLSLSYSRRASHQISTHTLRILLEDVLGYDDVRLVTNGAGLDVGRALQKLTHSKYKSSDVSPTGLPEIMVDTEVWVPVKFNSHKFEKSSVVLDLGPVTTHGRFGWYVPSEFVAKLWDVNRVIGNHWRAFKLKSVLQQLTQNITHFKGLQNLTDIQSSCGKVKGCSSGISHGACCVLVSDGRLEQCGIMLAGYPEHGGYEASQQVDGLKLNVSLLWLGSRLRSAVNYSTAVQRPYLVLNWEPNTLTASERLERVELPSCSDENKSCDFSRNHLKKFLWARIKDTAPDIHHLVSRLFFPRPLMNELLQQQEATGLHSSEVACHWIRHARDVWEDWVPELQGGKMPVYIGGMFPMSTGSDAIWSGPGVWTGAQMALERINKEPGILLNYSLKILVKDTQCRTDLTLNAFIDFVTRQSNRTYVGILGPACSNQAEIVAEVSPYHNIIVMGYSVEAVSLADRQKYPLYFRTSSSYFEFKRAYSSLFNRFDWKQYATLTEANYASSIVTGVHEHLAKMGVQLVYSRLIVIQNSVDIKTYLRTLKDSTATIIIGNLFGFVARAVICEAYRQELTPQNGYVWFLPSWLEDEWWNTDHYNSNKSKKMERVPCSSEDMRTFVNGGYFSLSNAYYGTDKQTVAGGTTVREWKKDYLKRTQLEGIAPSGYASYAYDAVWSYAVALDKLFREYPASLDTIRSNVTTQRLKVHLQQTNFTGTSGRVTFKEGERFRPIVDITQHFIQHSISLGRFIPYGYSSRNKKGDEQNGQLFLNESLIFWPTGAKPSDGRPGPRKLVCSVESFRASLGVTCSVAIAILNVICIGLFLAVVIALLWFCIKRRYENKYKETQLRMEELGLMDQSSVLQLDAWEVRRDRVILNRKLGEGAFGTVFGGEVDIKAAGVWVPVAVKTLKIGSTAEEKLEFLSESETMKIFDHDNIVKLLGVCTKGEPAFAIMELMIHGDLKSFLLARRQFANQDCKEAEDVTPLKLTRMARDVTCGLFYLASLKFVHRDLALRNCMVGSGHVVKLGDFGMTRAMFDSDYYRFGRKGMLPVRWMAPESLADGVFTVKSDVWSLGVTLWELATFGSFPYQGISNGELLTKVKLGYTMDVPPGCTEQFRQLLLLCWKMDSNSRPEPVHIMKMMEENPAMVTSCLDAPITSVPTAADCMQRTGSCEMISRQKPHTVFMRSPSPPNNRNRALSEINADQLKAYFSSGTPRTPTLSTSSLEDGAPVADTDTSPSNTHVFARPSPAGTPVFGRKPPPISPFLLMKPTSNMRRLGKNSPCEPPGVTRKSPCGTPTRVSPFGTPKLAKKSRTDSTPPETKRSCSRNPSSGKPLIGRTLTPGKAVDEKEPRQTVVSANVKESPPGAPVVYGFSNENNEEHYV